MTTFRAEATMSVEAAVAVPLVLDWIGALLTGHTDEVRWGAWANVAGRPILATGGVDRTVRLWDPAGAAIGAPLTGHTSGVRWGAWANAGGRPILATGGEDGTVRPSELRVIQVEKRRRSRYRSDAAVTPDQLARTGEAGALAEVIVARSAPPPLAIGVFGDWGSGKSVFLDLLRQQVSAAAQGPVELAVRSVLFNAWHYAETDLWASLVSEIFTQLATPTAAEAALGPGTAQRQRSRLAADVAIEQGLSERLAAVQARRDELLAARGRGWEGLSKRHQGQVRAAVSAVDPQLGQQVAGVYAAARGTLPWLRVRLLEARRVAATLPWWGRAVLA